MVGFSLLFPILAGGDGLGGTNLIFHFGFFLLFWYPGQYSRLSKTSLLM